MNEEITAKKMEKTMFTASSETTTKQVGWALLTVDPTGHYVVPARGRSPLSARLDDIVTGRVEITAATRDVKQA